MKSTSMYSTFYCKFTIKSKNYTHFSFSPYNQKSGLTFWGAVKKSIPCSEQKNNDPEDVKINRITQEKFSYTWILHSREKSDKITKFALPGEKTKNTVLLGCEQCNKYSGEKWEKLFDIIGIYWLIDTGRIYGTEVNGNMEG